MQTLVGLRFRRTLERLGEPVPAYLRQRDTAQPRPATGTPSAAAPRRRLRTQR